MPLTLPAMTGTIDRRILMNYRVDPAALAPHVPPPFRLKTVSGYAIAGICLIRLRQLRPLGLPAWLGVGSENAAHRIAVEWDADGRTHSGVYVPRRDTSSRLNTLAGGRLFEGYQHHARFTVAETATHLEVAVDSDDGARFPAGSASFDCALLMRGIAHEWRGRGVVCGAGATP